MGLRAGCWGPGIGYGDQGLGGSQGPGGGRESGAGTWGWVGGQGCNKTAFARWKAACPGSGQAVCAVFQGSQDLNAPPSFTSCVFGAVKCSEPLNLSFVEPLTRLAVEFT